MSPREKDNTQRINVFLTDEILEKVKQEAKENGMTVSGIVRLIVMKYFSDKK